MFNEICFVNLIYNLEAMVQSNPKVKQIGIKAKKAQKSAINKLGISPGKENRFLINPIARIPKGKKTETETRV